MDTKNLDMSKDKGFISQYMNRFKFKQIQSKFSQKKKKKHKLKTKI